MKNLLCLIFLFIAFCAHANPIYRWRDAQGHMHFDESKPLNQDYETVDEKALPLVNTAAAPIASENSTPKKTRHSNRDKNAAKKSNKKAKSADAAKKRCRRYDEQLENIANRLHAGYREPTGNHLRTKRRQLEQRVRDEC